MSALKLSSRQDYVIEQLYVSFGWSVLTIAFALELGRRTVSSALKRRSITLMRRSKKPFAVKPVIEPATAKQWFQHAATEELADFQPQEKQSGERVVYRRRRCVACEQLTSYATHCSRCGELLDYQKPTTLLDLETTELRKLEELR